MDTLNRYREIIRHIVQEYGPHKLGNGRIEVEIVIDPERYHYEVFHVGW
jgi:hypothetical protein